MQIDKKEFKKKYPKIAEEMERTNNKIRVNFNKTNSDSKKIRKEKVNGVVKLGSAVLRKRILVFVMNVKNFHAKNIPKN